MRHPDRRVQSAAVNGQSGQTAIAKHCSKIITLVAEYCLAQRVKPLSDAKTPFKSEDEYIEALKAHHNVMQAAMKCKQTVDPAMCEKLSADIDLVSKMYIK